MNYNEQKEEFYKLFPTLKKIAPDMGLITMDEIKRSCLDKRRVKEVIQNEINEYEGRALASTGEVWALHQAKVSVLKDLLREL